ncbi:MAG TPA: hypothetical protein DCY13_16550 [Verrucomicrobiales bacterium]|nr:hypothetical protein [Verrucomicrobiales bacterium]
MISQLSKATARQLMAADGWTDLGCPAEAHAELEQIAAEEKVHPFVLESYWRVYAAWGKWQRAFEVAESLVERQPGLAAGWLHRAYAARRMPGGTVQVAFDLLQPAAGKFLKEPIIPYNLACYCAQLGQLSDARSWLEQAFQHGDRKVLHRMALEDPDLEPLKAVGYLK